MVVLLAEAVGHLAGAFGRLGGDEDATELRRRRDQGRSGASSTRTERRCRRCSEVADLREVMGRREAYRRLSRIGDLVHTVAERVWYAVVKEA